MPRVFWRATIRFFREGRATVAAAIAYYSLFSLFPLGLVVLSALAYINPDLATSQPVLSLVQTYVPGAQDLVKTNLERLVRVRSGMGFFGALSLVWAASSVFAAIGNAMEDMLGRRRGRSPLRLRLVGLLMVVITALLAVASLLVTTLLAAVKKDLVAAERLPPWLAGFGLEVLEWITAGVVPAVVFGSVLLMYRYVPPLSPPFRDLWPGALAATVGLGVARGIFVNYVTGIRQYDLIYGSMGAVIVSMLWFFVSAAILLWGAEAGAVLHQVRSNGQTRDS